MELTPRQSSKIKKLIASECEKSFRRGYQHGHLGAVNKGVTEKEAYNFRFKKPKTKCAPTPKDNWTSSLEDRLDCENSEIMSKIREVL